MNASLKNRRCRVQRGWDGTTGFATKGGRVACALEHDRSKDWRGGQGYEVDGGKGENKSQSNVPG